MAKGEVREEQGNTQAEEGEAEVKEVPVNPPNTEISGAAAAWNTGESIGIPKVELSSWMDAQMETGTSGNTAVTVEGGGSYCENSFQPGRGEEVAGATETKVLIKKNNTGDEEEEAMETAVEQENSEREEAPVDTTPPNSSCEAGNHTMRCFGCGKEGHMVRACPEKASSREKDLAEGPSEQGRAGSEENSEAQGEVREEQGNTQAEEGEAEVKEVPVNGPLLQGTLGRALASRSQAGVKRKAGATETKVLIKKNNTGDEEEEAMETAVEQENSEKEEAPVDPSPPAAAVKQGTVYPAQKIIEFLNVHFNQKDQDKKVRAEFPDVKGFWDIYENEGAVSLQRDSWLQAQKPREKSDGKISIFLAEVVDGKLSPSRMVVVRFSESEATPQGLIGKVQDAIGSHDPIVLTDAQGNAILESEGTTGFIVEPVFMQCGRSIIGCKLKMDQLQKLRIPAVVCKVLLLQLSEATAPKDFFWDTHDQTSTKSVPYPEKTVPRAGAHSHAITGHPQTADPVIMPSENTFTFPKQQTGTRGRLWGPGTWSCRSVGNCAAQRKHLPSHVAGQDRIKKNKNKDEE
ncbi:hypothetical protein DNTS_026269 [Danionella cerebrum]|uniref:CCHC-type domain-containing protein n=1 Tax=Danionella cerebrum TaxID=2873325 RepID=A0A553N5J3_9TELE|nr:hypothetical protein DNTS_026269 [Danionella translucida]